MITMHNLVLATAREYQKLGKPITKADFGDQFYRLDRVDPFLTRTNGDSNALKRTVPYQR
jgi:hypothetical protein